MIHITKSDLLSMLKEVAALTAMSTEEINSSEESLGSMLDLTLAPCRFKEFSEANAFIDELYDYIQYLKQKHNI